MTSLSAEAIPISESLGEAEVCSWLDKGALAPLVKEWICWNNAPLQHVPLSSLTSFFPEKFYHSFLEDLRVCATVNALLKKRLSWDQPVKWAPHDFLWNIGMMAPFRLRRFAFLGASCSFFKEISQTIDGEIVRALRQELGEELLQFILLSGSAAKYVLEPLRTEILAASSSFGESRPLIELLKQASLALVDQAFSSKEKGIQQRMATKLPGCFAQGFVDSPLAWATEAKEVLEKLWNEASSWL